MMRVLVLTSRENFVWHSMQEIIPFIETQWAEVAKLHTEVEFLNVDDLSLSQILSSALKAQHIVLTCFNLKICKVAKFLRFEIGLNSNFIVYVHNMATIAFWPFRHWGQSDFFKKNDVFVSSCGNDLRTLNSVFNSPRVIQLPFCNSSFTYPTLNKPFGAVESLVYIGRISPQKNLHNLILALDLVRKRSPSVLRKLVFFGKEDHLGSPNMALENKIYQKQLDQLVKELNLEGLVEFKGHRPRDEIGRFLENQNCLCVTPSLHSDENFGMAVLQALSGGNQVLISDWGGHSDFKKYFFERVHLMPVRQSSYGPTLSARTIAENLERSLVNRPLRSTLKIPEEFNLKLQAERLEGVLSDRFDNDALAFSPLADRIFHARHLFENSHQTQIFKDYADALFHEISSFYIGQVNRRREPEGSSARSTKLVPWAQTVGDVVRVADPHKGEIAVSKDDVTNLINSGWLYLVD